MIKTAQEISFEVLEKLSGALTSIGSAATDAVGAAGHAVVPAHIERLRGLLQAFKAGKVPKGSASSRKVIGQLGLESTPGARYRMAVPAGDVPANFRPGYTGSAFNDPQRVLQDQAKFRQLARTREVAPITAPGEGLLFKIKNQDVERIYPRAMGLLRQHNVSLE